MEIISRNDVCFSMPNLIFWCEKSQNHLFASKIHYFRKIFDNAIIKKHKISKIWIGQWFFIRKCIFMRLKCLELKNIFLMSSHGNASLWVPIYVCWCFRFRVWRLNVWHPFVLCFHKKSPISTCDDPYSSNLTEITIVKI